MKRLSNQISPLRRDMRILNLNEGIETGEESERGTRGTSAGTYLLAEYHDQFTFDFLASFERVGMFPLAESFRMDIGAEEAHGC